MFDDGIERVRATLDRHRVGGLVVIGGEGSLSCANELAEMGMPIVGVPKTIDNDIGLTERTFGFDTAVQIATDAIDRLHTTAESHNRVMVVEVMGRHVGHIATWAGMAGGATMTLTPEEPFDIDEVCASLSRRHDRGKYASIVVVAEGALPKAGTLEVPEPEIDQFGHKRLGGIVNLVAAEIESRTGYETRVTVLGHVQAAAPQPRSIVRSRVGTASKPSTRSPSVISARWWPSRAGRWCGCRSSTRSPS